MDTVVMSNVEQGSLFPFSWEEAMKYKWIQSQKAGHDLGDTAIRDWDNYYMWRFCKERWLEHISGKRYWVELDPNDFGMIHRQIHSNELLVDRILDRIQAGWENLDILTWAAEWGLDQTSVIEILNVVDVNSQRLSLQWGWKK
jgi:hypothetical protein